jgi:uncharacterized SAM-binding protein YcdF (DUF218 family)
LITILKAIGPPGSIPFIGFCGLIALLLTYVWPKSARLARAWLAFVVIGHLILAVPAVANSIAGRLPRVASADAAALRDIDLVFVLDGDNRRGRVRGAAQASVASPASTVWILGGTPWLVDALAETGVARGRIKHDYRPADTREQIDWVRHMIADETASRTAIVASRLQMPRVAALSRVAGLAAMLIASPIDTEPPTSGWRVLVPSYYALRVSRDAIYEHFALSYYSWRGWI